MIMMVIGIISELQMTEKLLWYSPEMNSKCRERRNNMTKKEWNELV